MVAGELAKFFQSDPCMKNICGLNLPGLQNATMQGQLEGFSFALQEAVTALLILQFHCVG